MSFKPVFVKRAGVIASTVLALTSSVFAGELIRLIRPQSFQVTEPEQIIQGTVEAPSSSRITVEVQPFVSLDTTPQQRAYEFDVLSGHFQGKIKLFPGVNLIKVSTLGRQISIHSAIFLISPDQAQVTQKNWGAESQIVFTKPQTLRINTDKTLLEGIVTTQNIARINLIVLNSQHFKAMKEIIKKVYEINVKNMHFTVPVEFEDGHNIVLARPDGKPVKYGNIGLKSIIYERPSANINLQEPTAVKGTLHVSGQLQTQGKNSNVSIKVSALVKDKNTGELYLNTFADTNVKPDVQGHFQLEVPLISSNPGLEIKDFPVIQASAGKDSATKVLFEW